ncbi:MAG: hypothetical protein ACE5JI_04000 [Acidobacteriota bacterium]
MWSPMLLKALCTFGVLAMLASVAAARQTTGQGSQEVPAAGTAEQAAPEQEQKQEDLGQPIPEGIEVVGGTGYTYEARGRRDPFISLALGVGVLPPDVRPPGLAGMLIQEVSLRGIVKTTSGFIAMIQGTDNKSYFAREGERLYDGSIETIEQGRVVFRQEINDPLRIEKFQRIEKSLHPVEEGK